MLNRHFFLHYVEMVLVMFAGMFVLGLPAAAGLRVLGTSTSELQADAPAVLLLGMAIVMTVPMVAWMFRRGHTWRPSVEMAASMFLPTFAVIGLKWGGLVEDFGALMLIEHMAMFPSMLVAMLLRLDEYTGHPGHAHSAA